MNDHYPPGGMRGSHIDDTEMEVSVECGAYVMVIKPRWADIPNVARLAFEARCNFEGEVTVTFPDGVGEGSWDCPWCETTHTYDKADN